MSHSLNAEDSDLGLHAAVLCHIRSWAQIWFRAAVLHSGLWCAVVGCEVISGFATMMLGGDEAIERLELELYFRQLYKFRHSLFRSSVFWWTFLSRVKRQCVVPLKSKDAAGFHVYMFPLLHRQQHPHSSAWQQTPQRIAEKVGADR